MWLKLQRSVRVQQPNIIQKETNFQKNKWDYKLRHLERNRQYIIFKNKKPKSQVWLWEEGAEITKVHML